MAILQISALWMAIFSLPDSLDAADFLLLLRGDMSEGFNRLIIQVHQSRSRSLFAKAAVLTPRCNVTARMIERREGVTDFREWCQKLVKQALLLWNGPG
jgi:hypothetical protein